MAGRYPESSLSRTSSTGSLRQTGRGAGGGAELGSEEEDGDLHCGSGPHSANPSSSPSGAGGSSSSSSKPGLGGSGSSSSQVSQSYRERRREAHTQAEQKRRDAIKKGYDYLQDLVPTCQQEANASLKMSKATVLQKSIEHIQQVQSEKKMKEEELNGLRKEVIALQIMKSNYSDLVKVHQAQPSGSGKHVPSEVKFKTFQGLMDNLFESFNDNVKMDSFSELSGCTFSWLEEQCKPQLLQDRLLQILAKVRQEQQLENREEQQRAQENPGGDRMMHNPHRNN